MAAVALSLFTLASVFGTGYAVPVAESPGLNITSLASRDWSHCHDGGHRVRVGDGNPHVVVLNKQLSDTISCIGTACGGSIFVDKSTI